MRWLTLLLLWPLLAQGQNYNVTFSWDAASGSPTGYNLYCGATTAPKTYASPINVGLVTTYVATLPKAQTDYCCVSAYNGSGESACSNELIILRAPSFIIIGARQ